MHSLAENLSMTVARLSSELTLEEFNDWCAYYDERNSDESEPTDISELDQTQIGKLLNG